MSISHKSFLCQKKIWAMLKKEKKESMPKSMNNPMLKSMKKKKERKIAHTFK